eukprot:scaffold209438_cov25-Prasinocladus_malaysianus.AAC.2
MGVKKSESLNISFRQHKTTAGITVVTIIGIYKLATGIQCELDDCLMQINLLAGHGDDSIMLVLEPR